MFKSSVIIFGFTLGLLSTQGQATTYYLDSNSGNDFNSGAATASPLKSLRAASAMLYHPGDQILFKAGGVWTGETFDIATTDESGDPITIGSYGTGNQPVLDGANTAHSPMTLKNAHNVTVSNLTIQNAGTLITVDGGSNITIRNCTFRNAGVFAINMSQTSGFTFSNNNYATTGSFKEAGTVLRFIAAVNGMTVTNNKVTLNEASRGCVGLYVIDADNAVIAGNTFTGGSEGIGVKAKARSVTGAKVYNNAVYDVDNTVGDGEAIELTGWPNTPYYVSGSVYHNFVKGGSHTENGIAAFKTKNTAVYNNVVIGPMENAAIHWSSNSPGGLFYGNTIHDVRVGIAVFSGSSATVRNNILSKVEVSISADAPVSEDYNIFYESGNVGGSHGGHSTKSNPEFVKASPANPMDVRLQSSSPAKHSGAGLSSSYKEALNPASTSWPCTLLDQTKYGWNRGAFGSD